MKLKKQFLDLIQENRTLINKLVFLYGDTPEDKADLRQEILFQAWKSFPKFNGKSSFSTWLFRVGLNTSLTYLKHKKNTVAPIEPHLMVPDQSNTNPKAILEVILSVLNDIEKAIAMALIEGYQQQEISKMLGISYENVRIKIHRMRKKLKNYGIEGYLE